MICVKKQRPMLVLFALLSRLVTECMLQGQYKFVCEAVLKVFEGKQTFSFNIFMLLCFQV